MNTIELAKQAGLLPNHEVYEDDLQRFAELVRNEVLEEAANACEELARDWGDCAEESGMHDCKNMLRSMKK